MLGSTCLALLAFTNLPAARSQAPATTQASSSCVQTAAKYKEDFDKCVPITCVSPKLYGVIGGGKPADQQDIYPAAFYWAWVSGYENLQKYAAWQTQACNSGDVTQRILLYVGFGEDDIKAGDYTLSVMDLSKDPTLFVPTWEAWFQAFQNTFGLNFSLSTQKSLALTLGDSRNKVFVPLNPTRNFAEVTGCSATKAGQCSDKPLFACDKSYELAAKAIRDSSPIGGKGGKSGTTAECVAAFKSYIDDGTQRPADAAEARAMLRYCQDVNPCNSGRGFGFNPSWNASKGSSDVASHFTGREFVLRNRSLDSVDASKILLSSPTPPK